MTDSTPDKGAAIALVFQAPPPLPGSDQDDWDTDLDSGYRDRPPAATRRAERPAGSAGSATRGAGGQLRMLKGARAAAAGMKISDDQIRAVLDDPQDVQPDPNQPQRTQLRRDGLVVTTGNDGMILRVARR